MLLQAPLLVVSSTEETPTMRGHTAYLLDYNPQGVAGPPGDTLRFPDPQPKPYSIARNLEDYYLEEIRRPSGFLLME